MSFLMFRWNLLYFTLCPLPLVLSMSTPEKSLSSFQPLFWYLQVSVGCPLSLLFSRMKTPSSFSLSPIVEMFQSLHLHCHVLLSSSICMPLLYWEGQNWTQQWPDMASPLLSRGEGSPPLACWQCFA